MQTRRPREEAGRDLSLEPVPKVLNLGRHGLDLRVEVSRLWPEAAKPAARQAAEAGKAPSELTEESKLSRLRRARRPLPAGVGRNR